MAIQIYIASAFANKPAANEFAAQLRCAGYEVTSTWHKLHTTDAVGSVESEHAALKSLREIDQCDVVVALLTDGHQRGGKDFECGYAFGTEKVVLFVGPRQHIFHYMPSWRWPYTWFATTDEVLKYIHRWKEQWT